MRQIEAGTIIAVLVIVCGNGIWSAAVRDTEPIVDTPQGRIRGLVSDYNGNRFEQFLGVPFAAPPLGALRWKKPVPPEPWTDVRNATQFSLHCTHLLAYFYVGAGLSSGQNGEDCLYLNVWVPNGVAENEGRKLPVMMFLYGGGYTIGTGELYPGYALAIHADVIVVNINYRVNVFGFLSTDDEECPGNFGLWDQRAALLWVQQNIDSFNGDPNRVTVFGQSAGAGSVSHLVISPHTNTLFHNAIAISGSSTAAYSLTMRQVDMAIDLAQLADCPAHNSHVIIECLGEKNAHLLSFLGFVAMALRNRSPPQFLPVIDGDFVPRNPAQSFQMGEGKHINFMTGFAYHDTANMVVFNILATPILGDRINLVRTNETLYRNAMLLAAWAANPDELLQEMFRMYPGMNTEDLMTRTLATVMALTDNGFGAPSNWEARQHANAGGTGRTYQYVFHYRQSFLVGYADWIQGAHIDDLYSILGDIFLEFYRLLILRRPFSLTDRMVSNRIMDYYTNFAHTGNPNEGPKTVAVEWKEFTEDNQNYLEQSANFQMKDFYEDNIVDRYRFWTEHFPTVIVPRPPATYPPENNHKSATSSSRTFSWSEIEEAIDTVRNNLHESMGLTDDAAWSSVNNIIESYISEMKERFQ